MALSPIFTILILGGATLTGASVARRLMGAAKFVAFGVASFATLVACLHLLGAASALAGIGLVRPWTASALAVVAGLLAWFAPAFRGERPAAAAGGATRRLWPRGWAGIALAAGSVFLLNAVVTGLSAPPRGWDVLTYHMPMASGWLQYGDLAVRGAAVGGPYPGNAELGVLTLLMSGSDRLAPLLQIPFVFLGAAALFGIARELGARRQTAAVPAAILLLSPIVFFQSTIPKNDVVVAALVAAGAYFLLRTLERGRSGAGGTTAGAATLDVVLAGLAFGLALGTKYSILPVIVMTIPLFAAFHLLAARGGGRRASSWALRAALVFIAALAVPSVFWFLRNLVTLGNPIAPLSMRLGDWAGAAPLSHQYDYVIRESDWWIYPWYDRHVGGMYSGAVGFGAAFGAFYLPGLALSLRAAIHPSSGRVDRLKHAAILALVALAVIAWWYGKHHLPRFLIPAMALAAAPVAVLFEAVAERARRVLAAALVFALLFSSALAVRGLYTSDDVTWSYTGPTSSEEFYAMPRLIYELPPRTKILLLKPTNHTFYKTYRYPLVGSPPGNDVVMEEDYGVDFDIKGTGALDAYASLRRNGIEYVFMRTIGLPDHTTWFDNYPDLYELVFDEDTDCNPWYRVVFKTDEDGNIIGLLNRTTRIYRLKGA